MEKLTRSLGIDHRLTTPYHPRANGLAERWVQSSVQVMRKKVQGAGLDWDYYLPSIQLELNNRISKRLNTPPFSLMFARKLNAFKDYRDKSSTPTKPMTYHELLKRIEHMSDIVFPALKEKANIFTNKQKESFDKKYKRVDYPEGSHVIVRIPIRTSKLAPAYEGPYTVLRRTQGGSYIL